MAKSHGLPESPPLLLRTISAPLIAPAAPANLQVLAMAETVYLADGSREVILGDKGVFLERLIREKLGDDAARCFTEYVSELQEELAESQEISEDQERSADGYLQMCRDARDALQEICYLLEQPRLNRSDLQEVAERGYNDLNENL